MLYNSTINAASIRIYYMKILFCIILCFNTFIYGQKDTLKIDNSFRDSSKYEILILSKTKTKPYYIDSNFKDANLSVAEIKLIETLFFKSVKYHNSQTKEYLVNGKIYYKGRKTDYPTYIPLTVVYYCKQLIPYINKKGEKEIYINCFYCNPSDPHWNELLETVDGGVGFFHLIINLKTKKCLKFHVNEYG